MRLATPAVRGPVGASLVCAAVFLVVRPPVGDLWAARARESAVADGVGVRYWFSWFAGIVPGHYSVLAPTLARLADIEVLGAVATVAITPLTWLLVRHTRHPLAATWVATGAASLSLWSGRLPFAQGMALALVAFWLVRTQRLVRAVLLGVVTVLVSPVSAAFLSLSLVGVVVHDPVRRATALATIAASGLVFVAIGMYFGTPGPEGFTGIQTIGAGVACVLMLLTRPEPPVRTVLWISLVACPVVAIVPNGLGSNFERFTWLCLPAAAVAAARVAPRRAVAAAVVAVGFAAIGSAKDLWVATQPQSDPGYYAGVIHTLDRTPNLANYRVEAVPDGAHVSSAVLLDHATLARGYETQSDGGLNAVLLASHLDAAGYRRWLDRFAVGYVLLDRHTLYVTPEDDLIRHHRPAYLRMVWSDQHFELYAVLEPTPIVAAPARIVDADQAEIEIQTARPCTVLLRVHWSRFLLAADRSRHARLRRGSGGFTMITMPAPGLYVVHA